MARYSLWLMPPREAHERFRTLIARLSARLGTPAFEPHVTLFGSVAGAEEELRRRAYALAAAIEPLEVRLRKVGWRDEYYRCLFVEVAPSQALQGAHEAAGRHFDQRPDVDFYPHMSLVYGDLEQKTKAEILDDIGRTFDESIRLEDLVLFETSGPPSAWRCVVRARLGGGDNR